MVEACDDERDAAERFFTGALRGLLVVTPFWLLVAILVILIVRRIGS